MTEAARDRIATLLSETLDQGRFSAARTVPPDNLHLEVRGVGALRLPLSQAQARRLHALGRPARYGRGELTLLDPAVRDTAEIARSRVRIDKRRWNATLLPILDRLREDLGLADGCPLSAELHSMLVYGPGQFFLPHQDSEKEDGMIGTLVVTLPSQFTGGVLQVEHRGEIATYRGSRQGLSFVAFYADCHHQIKPVKSGYRVVLTYNLTLRGDTTPLGAEGDPELVGQLARCVDRHFAGDEGPNRLVYLLDHQYTPRGLGWSALKGADASRVASLRAAAERAGCEAVLGLADVHETWSAFESDRWDGPWSRGRRYGRWQTWCDADDDWDHDEGDDEREDRPSDEAASDDYDLEELIECEVTLDSWLEPSGRRMEKLGLSIREDELSASTPSGDLSPYAQEYEGYMGNWGNTLDRWYHRGAVVIWPRSRDFAVRAEISPSWAMDSLSERIGRGDLAGARQAVVMLVPFWDRLAARVEGRGFLAKTLRTARLLDEPALATMLLGPFRLEALGLGNAKAWRALVERYGQRWAAQLVASWSDRRRYLRHGTSRQAWAAGLARLCAALHDGGGPGTEAAVVLLRESWRWLSGAVEGAVEFDTPSRRVKTLAELGPPAAALREGAALAGAVDLRDEVVGLLCGNGQDVVACAMAALRAAPASGWAAAGLDAVAKQCRQILEERVGRPARASEDWSIQPPAGCECELCKPLGGFLADPARRVFEWPLAKDRRAHVHHRIDSAELPVDHRTRRTGRPYTLVLTKTEDLFRREKRARRRDETDLAWLEKSLSPTARPRPARSEAQGPGVPADGAAVRRGSRAASQR